MGTGIESTAVVADMFFGPVRADSATDAGGSDDGMIANEIL
jgi:hypothetical protein